MERLLKLYGKILIADDEKINVDFFKIMLKKLGFRVDVAYDGEEVLEKVQSFEPDLILLDLLMPKMSGFDVAKRLKAGEHTQNIPIIILTAVNDIKEKVDMLELGIEDYITKPFNFIEILARIRNILKSKFLKDEIARREKKLDSVKELEVSLEEFLKKTRSYTEEIVKLCEKELTGDSSSKKELVKDMYEMGKENLLSVQSLENIYDQYKRMKPAETVHDIQTRNAALDEIIRKNLKDHGLEG